MPRMAVSMRSARAEPDDACTTTVVPMTRYIVLNTTVGVCGSASRSAKFPRPMNFHSFDRTRS